MGARPHIVLLRGHHANVWDLRPWELLRDEFDISVLVTGSNVHQVDGLALDLVRVRTPRDVLPRGRVSGGIAYLLGERYAGLERELRGVDIVHAAELSTWFSAQAAGLRNRMRYRLAVTVWETIPWGAAYRWPRERRYRQRVLDCADTFLPTTERAKRALLLEGVDPKRIEVCPPGIDVAPFAEASPGDAGGPPLVLSVGRLVWQKGHQDVLRAVAALRRGLVGPRRDDVELAIVGSGPEEGRLRRHADDLGIAHAVTFRPTVPYEEMPRLYARASALVLASLPTRGWEEQFGMVLVEALAAGTPVVASSSGAIPEVLDGAGTLFDPGDWARLARKLGERLDGASAARSGGGSTVPERYSAAAAAARYRAVYERLLA